jgi:hypothetical protein
MSRSTLRKILVAMSALMMVFALACASDSGHKKKKRKKLPPPPMAATNGVDGTDAHFDDVKKAASEQLECPIEQILVQCTQKDRDDNCIAVKATGCDKAFEYQFGNE